MNFQGTVAGAVYGALYAVPLGGVMPAQPESP